MISVPFAVFEQIRRPPNHRALTLPKRTGIFGEPKPCPVKPRHAYRLACKPRSESELSDRYLQARSEMTASTRRQEILNLLRLVEPIQDDEPHKPVMITVTAVAEADGEWLVAFMLGNRTADDGDVFLGRNRDYTSSGAMSIDPAAPIMGPTRAAIEQAREKAREQRETPVRNELVAMQTAHKRLMERRHTMRVESRRRLERTGKALESLAASLSVDSGGIFDTSGRSHDQAPPEANGAGQSTGLASDAPLAESVSLEPAA